MLGDLQHLVLSLPQLGGGESKQPAMRDYKIFQTSDNDEDDLGWFLILSDPHFVCVSSPVRKHL